MQRRPGTDMRCIITAHLGIKQCRCPSLGTTARIIIISLDGHCAPLAFLEQLIMLGQRLRKNSLILLVVIFFAQGFHEVIVTSDQLKLDLRVLLAIVQLEDSFVQFLRAELHSDVVDQVRVAALQ